MLKFCQGRASSEILSLAADISLAAKSETGLNIDAIDISLIGDNLAFFEVFICGMHLAESPIVFRSLTNCVPC